MGKCDGFIKGLLYFLRILKIPLRSMSYGWSAQVISTGVKTNHTYEGLGKNLVFLSYLKVYYATSRALAYYVGVAWLNKTRSGLDEDF